MQVTLAISNKKRVWNSISCFHKEKQYFERYIEENEKTFITKNSDQRDGFYYLVFLLVTKHSNE